MRRQARAVLAAADARDGRALRAATEELREALAEPQRLGGKVDIARAFNVSEVAVWKWMQREGFPAPVATLGRGAIYDLDDIEEWRKNR